MRGGRNQRHHHVLIGFFFLTLVVAGCAYRRSSSDDELYLQAADSIKRGDFKNAQALAEKGNATWQDKPQSPWYWKYRVLLAESLIELGRSKDALPLLETKPPNQPEFAEAACRLRTVSSKALIRLARPKDAVTSLDEAESCAATLGLKAAGPENHVVRYALLETFNRPLEAESVLKEALKLAEEQKDIYWQSVALNNLGYRRMRESRYDEALAYLARAEEGFRKIDAKLRASNTQINIALSASRLGDFDRAIASSTSAIEIQEREGAKPYLQASLGSLGNIHTFQREFAKAVPYYQRALSIALEIGSVSDASIWAGNLASSMTSLRNWEQAAKFNEQSRELKARINDTGWHTRLYAADIALGQGKADDAERLYLEVIQGTKDPALLWEAEAGLSRLYKSARNNRQASLHFENAIRVIETSQSELARPDYKITFLARMIEFYQRYVDALVEWKEYDRALQIADSSRARVLVERVGRARAGLATTTDQDLAAWQQSGNIVLSYWLAPKRSFLWVLTPKTRKLIELPAREEIESLVSSYLAFVHDLRDPLDTENAAGKRLYETLLAPARDLIPAGAKVVIVPDGALHNLNFEMLPVPGATAHYWIEDVVPVVAPSLAVRAPSEPAGNLQSLLLIGNPESAGADYQRLPNAGEEVRSVERRMASLQKTVYEGAHAEPAVYRESQPDRFSVIHFAAHASANRESPLESAIILSPGKDSFKLYARDVTQVPLHAELVTISACRGAGARVYSGEGLVGFTWAFLQAGARHVIAGLWDVTDRSTAQLMDTLYENISKGAPPARALRDAKLAMIHTPGNFKKPYYWAPFQVYIGTGRTK